MSAASYTAPDELVQQLESYSQHSGTPDELVQLLRPPRLALRSTPSLRRDYGSAGGFWPALSGVWEVEAGRLQQDDKASIPAVTALAAFLLSLCTQEPDNQAQAVEHVEPQLRKVLLFASSLFNLEDAAYQDMTRLCCQALANLVTGSEAVAARFFPERLQLEEHDHLLQRLLAAPDPGTLMAVLIFLINSIHSSRDRALLLGTSKAGSALVDRLMTLVGALFDDDEEGLDGATKGRGASDIFALTFSIVQRLIDLGVFAESCEAHALMPGFAIDPTQVTLLKFLDGHLSSSPSASTCPATLALIPFLLRQLSALTTALARTGTKESADAATFQGVVLVLHCLVEIGLGLDKREQERIESGREGGEEEEEKERVKSEMIAAVEDVVDLLRFSQTLLPPPTSATAGGSSSSTSSAAPKVVELDSSASSGAPASPSSASLPALLPAVAQLQRLCAQLLGILAYSSSTPGAVPSAATTRAQDKVRETGGLVVLLGMCQIDERNPTMREHALFAIRTLLKNNQANQDFVDGLKAQYMVGAGGELLDLPPSMQTE